MVCSLLGTFAIFAFGQGGQPTVEDAFVNYKREYQRKYIDSSKEHQVRFLRFKDAYSQVYKSNDAPVLGGEFQFDEYSDATKDEFYQRRLGFVFKNSTKTFLSQSLASNVGSQVMADSLDWVAQGAVTAVKDQQSCGSCWAFTVTGALEGAVKVATGTLIDLSEEQFLDCDGLDGGCAGGRLATAFSWAASKGLCSEQQYPYANGRDGICENTQCNSLPGGCVTGSQVAPGHLGLLQAVSGRPVSVAVAGSALSGYKGGVIYMGQPCSQNMIDHGLVVVGYTPDYWRVKNSWGALWGEGGYARILRETSPSFQGQFPDQGPLGAFCIYSQPVYATISPTCTVNSAGVSDKDDLWSRISASAFFWPVVIAILCSSCLTVVAVMSYLRSRGRKARPLCNAEQGSGVSMLGF